ncbi:MAG: outer membrane beta-barrel protein [Candidatus Aminicenantales bacterium]
MKKIPVLSFLLFLSANVSFGQEQRVQLTFTGGVNYHFVYGSEQDYVLGENDFPVTPAHRPIFFGGAYTMFFGHFGTELEGRYTLSSRALLVDPSDKDTVEIKTHPHLTLALNVLYRFFLGAISPYILAGGGMDAVFAKDASYTSKYGYEIFVAAPAKKDRIDAEVHAGAGIQFFLGSGFGLRADGRYVWIFDKPESVKSIQAALGFFVSF